MLRRAVGVALQTHARRRGGVRPRKRVGDASRARRVECAATAQVEPRSVGVIERPGASNASFSEERVNASAVHMELRRAVLEAVRPVTVEELIDAVVSRRRGSGSPNGAIGRSSAETAYHRECVAAALRADLAFPPALVPAAPVCYPCKPSLLLARLPVQVDEKRSRKQRTPACAACVTLPDNAGAGDTTADEASCKTFDQLVVMASGTNPWPLNYSLYAGLHRVLQLFTTPDGNGAAESRAVRHRDPEQFGAAECFASQLELLLGQPDAVESGHGAKKNTSRARKRAGGAALGDSLYPNALLRMWVTPQWKVPVTFACLQTAGKAREDVRGLIAWTRRDTTAKRVHNSSQNYVGSSHTLATVGGSVTSASPLPSLGEMSVAEVNGVFIHPLFSLCFCVAPVRVADVELALLLACDDSPSPQWLSDVGKCSAAGPAGVASGKEIAACPSNRERRPCPENGGATSSNPSTPLPMQPAASSRVAPVVDTLAVSFSQQKVQLVYAPYGSLLNFLAVFGADRRQLEPERGGRRRRASSHSVVTAAADAEHLLRSLLRLNAKTIPIGNVRRSRKRLSGSGGGGLSTLPPSKQLTRAAQQARKRATPASRSCGVAAVSPGPAPRMYQSHTVLPRAKRLSQRLLGAEWRRVWGALQYATRAPLGRRAERARPPGKLLCPLMLCVPANAHQPASRDACHAPGTPRDTLCEKYQLYHPDFLRFRASPSGPSPAQTDIRGQNRGTDDVLCFPLSLEVFYRRICTTIVAVGRCNPGQRLRRRRQRRVPPGRGRTTRASGTAVATGKSNGELVFARLDDVCHALLWTHEYGPRGALSLLRLYLSHFVPEVRVTRCRRWLDPQAPEKFRRKCWIVTLHTRCMQRYLRGAPGIAPPTTHS